MASKAFIPGQLCDLPLKGRSFVAVDLGFGASKSCGIAVCGVENDSKPILRSFGGCVAYIASLILEGKIESLIVEAPLSGVFNGKGDSQWRQPFEQQQGDKKTECRYWYTQPGSTVCLAAVAFFSQLSKAIANAHNPVLVFEGFFTFKPKGKSNHCHDAVRLAEAAQDPKIGVYFEVPLPKNGQLLTVLSLLGIAAADSAAPAVIACKA